MAYLTPDSVTVITACRSLIVPDDEQYLAVVRGALQELTFPSSWVKQGALTPEQAADAFVPMFDSFCFDDTCVREDPSNALVDELYDVLFDIFLELLLTL